MLQIGTWRFDPTLNQLSSGAELVTLEPLASNVLEYLARHPNKVVSNDELTGNLWGRRLVGDSPVYRIIADLRRALGDDARNPNYIETIRKRGYRLVAQVAELTFQAGDPASLGVPMPPPLQPKHTRYRNFSAIAATLLAISLAASSRLPLHATEPPSEESELVTLLADSARVLMQRNDFDRAEQSLIEARTLLRSAHKTQTRAYVSILTLLANAKKQRNDLIGAYDLYDEALSIDRTMLGDGDKEIAFVLSGYASAKMWGNDFIEAERLSGLAVEILRRELSPRHPDRIAIESLYGMALLRNGRVAEAAPLLEESYRNQELIFGNGSFKLVEPLWNLAELRRIQQDLPGARELHEKALLISLATMGKLHLVTAQSREKLGITQWRLGQLSNSERELRSAIEVYRAVLPADNLYICVSEHFLSEVLLAERRSTDAIAQLQITLSRLERLHAQAWRIARSENTLGQAMVDNGQVAAGKAFLERSNRQLSSDSKASPELVQLSLSRMQALKLKGG